MGLRLVNWIAPPPNKRLSHGIGGKRAMQKAFCSLLSTEKMSAVGAEIDSLQLGGKNRLEKTLSWSIHTACHEKWKEFQSYHQLLPAYPPCHQASIWRTPHPFNVSDPISFLLYYQDGYGISTPTLVLDIIKVVLDIIHD